MRIWQILGRDRDPLKHIRLVEKHCLAYFLRSKQHISISGRSRTYSVQKFTCESLIDGRRDLFLDTAILQIVIHFLQILVIAVLMKLILHRSFNVFQWEALVLLVAGITVNQLNYCPKAGGGTPLAMMN